MRNNQYWMLTGLLFLLFAAFTILVSAADVQPIGPEQSEVGLATLNGLVFERIGVNMMWYHITEWLGMAVLLTPICFATMGFWQLIQRKSLWKVDAPLLLLGVFYVLVAMCYLFFEKIVVNYRPIVLGGGLEASYPSSHTVLVICVMASAMIACRHMPAIRKPLRMLLNTGSAAIIVVTVAGRLLSGVHWFTDIAGGALLSAALVMLYTAACISAKRK